MVIKKCYLYYNLLFDYNIIIFNMKTKVFISKPHEGWSEVNIPEEFRKCSYEKIVRIAHQLVHKSMYKGLLITQNPSPFAFGE